MSADIVPLKPAPAEPAEPRVWVCGQCNCQDFLLYENGSTECSLCGAIDTTQRAGWVEKLQPDPEFERPTAARHSASHGTADFARASIVRDIDDEVCVIALVWPNGRIRLWSCASRTASPERQQWMHDAMRNVASLALGESDTLDPMPE